jgi:hypothetical protein
MEISSSSRPPPGRSGARGSDVDTLDENSCGERAAWSEPVTRICDGVPLPMPYYHQVYTAVGIKRSLVIKRGVVVRHLSIAVKNPEHVAKVLAQLQ